MSSHQESEAGFTLVEMLVAVALLGVVMAGLGGLFFVGFRTTDETANRLSGSNDALFLSVYLLPDVQSATEAIASSNGTGIVCTGAANPKLQLTDSTTLNVVYGVREVGDQYHLERHVCTGGSVSTTKVIARNLASTSSVTPTRTPATGTLTGASLTVTEAPTTSTDTSYEFTVSGKRRAS